MGTSSETLQSLLGRIEEIKEKNDDIWCDEISPWRCELHEEIESLCEECEEMLSAELGGQEDEN